MTRDEVEARLAAHEPLEVSAAGGRRAAVLVGLQPDPKEALGIILTRRAEHLPSHAGQVSFPGGSLEPQDDGPEAAALREAHEELAIEPSRVEVLGRLDDMFTITGFHVVPVVGVVPRGVRLVPDPSEVERVFTVPLEVFLDEGRWELRTHAWRGSEFQVWHLPFDGEDIWGATATMLRGFVELLRA